MVLGIIGTAGRKDDAFRLKKTSFDTMCRVANEFLIQFEKNNNKIDTLVSGGAAWADHVAVNLFLNKKVQNLILYIPTEFQNGLFLADSTFNKFSPGNTLNYYHSKFQSKTKVLSLQEIQSAIEYEAKVVVCSGGFHGRNTEVANTSDVLLAMTFGNKNIVKDGGTADTVRKYIKRINNIGIFPKCFHYNLFENKLYNNGLAP